MKKEISLKPNAWYGARHTQAVLLFVLLTIGYAMRVILSVGIVAMTDKTASSNPDIPTYDWDDKSVVLSSFYWGYVMLQVIAGYCATRYGAKLLLTCTMIINSAACIAIPFMADEFGSKGVMACRVAQGLSQGFFYPSTHTLLGQWAPTYERSQLGTFVYSGASFGTILGLIITGLISASSWGWPMSFYFFGATGLLWCIWWYLCGSSKPSEHPTISKEEQFYIESSLGHLNHENIPTPWKSILTSLPMWMIVVASFGQNWGYTTLLTEIPNYLHAVMGFDMKSNSLLSAAPYLANWIVMLSVGPISDFVINRRMVSRGTGRKIFNSIGVCVPALGLAILSYLPSEQKLLSVALLVMIVGINGAVASGYQVNHIDISPNFSGILMGITNGSSNIFSIIAPLAVQVIVTDEADKSLWRIVFLTASILFIISAVFFNMFASGEIQKWNYIQSQDSKKPTEKFAYFGGSNVPTNNQQVNDEKV
ncbi:hypothetical protein WA026_000245 [Henosepilachna vigintioctopunctata]|uniref:Putative inorganic phosphate cotransporter n=1 Tax=Henosepilachna vigintioctopunctata TaxID=420089 RepID=A0AAW1V5E8_9CUCU